VGIGVRTVATWRQMPELTPKSEMQPMLDTALERPTEAARGRFYRGSSRLRGMCRRLWPSVRR
jgi:hypothetical protein